MANRMKNIGGLFSDTKTRIIMLFTLVILVLAVVFGYFGLRTTAPPAPAPSRVSAVTQIASVPGGTEATLPYYKTQEALNRQLAEQAARTGTSAVPTIVGKVTFSPELFGKAAGDGGFAKACVSLKDKYPYCFAGITAEKPADLLSALNSLAAACRAGMPPSACRAALERLVREGKLSQAAADNLFAAFGKKPAPESPLDSTLAQLVKDGVLSPALAAEINAACKKGESVAKCQALLRKLVAEGKLSPELAKKLLEAQMEQKIATACKKGMPPSVCEALIKRLEAEGELSPAQAAALLKKYGIADAAKTKAGELLANLIKDGKISPALAAEINAACKKGMPRSVCEALLQKLVAEGKLSPAEARALEGAYDVGKAAVSPGEAALGGLVGQGIVSPTEAEEIEKACRKGAPPGACAALMRKLIAEGKLSAAEARKLLRAYGRTVPGDLAGSQALGELVKDGTLTPTEAEEIQEACRKGAPPGECAALMRKLIAEGKLSPAEARKLLAAFGRPTTGILDPGASELAKLVKAGLLPGIAKEIAQACSKNMPPQACAALLKKLIAEGKLTPAQARALLAAYGKPGASELTGVSKVGQLVQAGMIPPNIAEEIQQACHKGAPPGACARLLQRLVQEGLLTASQAKKLLAAYQRTGEITAPTPAVATTPSLTTAIAEAPGERRQPSLGELMAKQQLLASKQQLSQEVKQLEGAMNKQAGALFTAWTPKANQTYRAAQDTGKSSTGGNGANGTNGKGGGSSAATDFPAVKAGNIQFAVLTTGANSDYSTAPIMARIVQGKFKGARLIGALVRQNKRIIISFKLMSLPSYPKSLTIDAVAIDAKTAQTALATHVDNHYLLRYGTLFAASFVSGFSEALQSSGATIASTGFGSLVKVNPKLSPSEEIAVALGKVGTEFGNVLAPLANTPPTITVDSGTGVGILFLQDTVIPKLQA